MNSDEETPLQKLTAEIARLNRLSPHTQYWAQGKFNLVTGYVRLTFSSSDEVEHPLGGAIWTTDAATKGMNICDVAAKLDDVAAQMLEHEYFLEEVDRVEKAAKLYQDRQTEGDIR